MKRILLVVLASSLVAGCASEKSCYDQIIAEIEAKKAEISPQTVEDREHLVAYAESAVIITGIHLDKYRNACDYYLRGTRIAKK